MVFEEQNGLVPRNDLRVRAIVLKGSIKRPSVVRVVELPHPDASANAQFRIDRPRSVNHKLAVWMQRFKVQAQERIVWIKVARVERIVVKIIPVRDLLREAQPQRRLAITRTPKRIGGEISRRTPHHPESGAEQPRSPERPAISEEVRPVDVIKRVVFHAGILAEPQYEIPSSHGPLPGIGKISEAPARIDSPGIPRPVHGERSTVHLRKFRSVNILPAHSQARSCKRAVRRPAINIDVAGRKLEPPIRTKRIDNAELRGRVRHSRQILRVSK